MVLQASLEKYEKTYNEWIRHERTGRQQRFRIKLHQHGCVNQSVTKILRGQRVFADFAVKKGDDWLIRPHDILDEVDRKWAPYYSKTPQRASEWWKNKYTSGLVWRECDCGRLDATHLQGVLAHAKVNSSPGPDSWRTAELKALPRRALQQLADIFNAIEQHEHWPQPLACSWTAMLAKSCRVQCGSKIRPIVLHSIVFRLWSSARYHMAAKWADETFDKQYHAYLPGRDARTAATNLSCQIDGVLLRRQHGSQEQFHMIALDCQKAFPSVSREQAAEVLCTSGVSPRIVGTWLQHYRQ
eukprot:5172562-Amphidinium_carterae.1